MAESDNSSHRIEVITAKKPYEKTIEEIPFQTPIVRAPSTTDFSEFIKHPWVVMEVYNNYERENAIAEQALKTVISHLNKLNIEYKEATGKVLFTTLEGRVKKKESYLLKLFSIYQQTTKKKGMTNSIFSQCFEQIHDVLGVRFAVPYYDQVLVTIKEVLRPKLQKFHYAVNIVDEEFADKNYLDKGDENGYRSYHFYVRVPTCINLYGDQVGYLCEIQARSELQHVWAVKSHDLFYKNNTTCIHQNDKNLKEDMKQISNQLRAIDQLLVSIRDRFRGEDKI